ncbi:hypothetical protein BDV40DRAFT_62173 [Aspergillus tamarii]|uniref:Uncharacterized protein n=1 Tax=Aspergillus tamarii TaxID=41984 RepID=A0A5N6UEL9_ASPTM|nr:hypothetical protein BDV40DRAFT_62173 [Aspergillus tamarii]
MYMYICIFFCPLPYILFIRTTIPFGVKTVGRCHLTFSAACIINHTSRSRLLPSLNLPEWTYHHRD